MCNDGTWNGSVPVCTGKRGMSDPSVQHFFLLSQTTRSLNEWNLNILPLQIPFAVGYLRNCSISRRYL